MKHVIKTDVETARNLTKAAKKEGFYFRTLQRTDRTEIVECEVTEPGIMYIISNKIKYEQI